jgi:ABC-type lipoprotein export system ATPase subunit
VWDLQVHTPFSELNNGFGSDLEAYAKSFFTKAVANEVAVVGVTDYFVVEGYRYLTELQNDDARLAALIGAANVEAAKQIRLFANVELRCDIIVNGSRVNFHVIFSDEVSADDIESNFLHQLQFTFEGNPGGVDQKLALTKANLELLGKTLKADHPKFKKDSDLFVGMAQATVHHTDVTSLLTTRAKAFGGRCIFCVPCDEDLSKVSWDGQAHMTRKVLMQKSQMFFTSNANTRDFALGRKHPTSEAYLKEFRSFKPCVHGSDAHNIDELFVPAEGRLTWIKADPTFKGLLQVINEPDSRVYVGKMPPALEAIRQRSTKIVRELGIHKKTGSTLPEKWFDHRVPLNPELVAIIGNKGSGKSALADILGLLGSTPRHKSFSFLSADRFRDRKNNKAKHFEASATWADDKVDGPVSLDDTPEDGAVETVKYIPQDYLETICNEVSLGSGSQFYSELQNVIFSHVSAAEQLGFSSLDELLAHRSEETKRAIDFLVDQLRSINREIVICEEQLTDNHRKALEAQLAAKQREIEAYDLVKPPAHKPPAEDPETAKLASSVSAQLQKLQTELGTVEEDMQKARQRLALVTKRRTVAERLLGKLSNLEKQFKVAEIEARLDVAELGLEWATLASFSVDTKAVEDVVSEAASVIAELTKRIAPDTEGSLAVRQQQLKLEIAQLGQQLSAPQRAFEEHKEKLKSWEGMRAELEGSEEQLGSLRQIKAALSALPGVRERHQELRKDRIAKAREIYKEKEKLRNDYGRYYGAVQHFLSTHPIAQGQQFKLTFNVAISDHGFANGFWKLLNQRRGGTYAGLEEGATRLRQLLDATNFDSTNEVDKFLVGLMRSLRQDQRPGRDGIPVDLKLQLAQGVSTLDVYDYVFGLSYLEPIYNLRWDGKTLEQLSPGERGNLLLIFYLLIDRDDIPLIIDQPEENLDNHTVYRTLVPCVKEAKSRRQIVMVTHNPNLAVVCDAEQVICAEIKKDQGHEVRYLSGSIEDPLINRKIVDILEGTRPAFDKRDAKYLSATDGDA